MSDRGQWLVFAGVALVLALAMVLLAGRYSGAQADARVTERGRIAGQQQVQALAAALDKQRAVRFLIARDAEVRAALLAPEPAALAGLNAKLEVLNEGAGADVIYVIDRNGLAVASSNYRSDISFVGNDYSFRPYFQEALAGGSAQLFALGTVSRRPGLYIAERIEGPEGPLGVAVVKIAFDALEASWQAGGGASYVTDARGVVLLSSIKAWQFFATGALAPDAIAALRKSLQFEEAPLQALPISGTGENINLVMASVPPALTPSAMASVTEGVPSMDWTLTTMLPVAADRSAAMGAARALGLLALTPFLAAAAGVLGYLQRNRRAGIRLVQQRQQLEAAVATRTSDLAASNGQLQRAIDARNDAETRAQRLRDDLAQANRLGVLGQIAAGVAHEINQPLGAIRAYAENGRLLLQRRDEKGTDDNLAAIARLTERIDAITEHLRNFARKTPPHIGSVDLAAAVEAALALLNAGIRHRGVSVDYVPPAASVRVVADQMGLEQIVVNLVQNALEALGDRSDPRIGVTIGGDGDEATLTIVDNGPGIAPEMRAQLFTPFSTSKPRGLGLGLVICHDLATAFGGTLVAEPASGGGAGFTLSLRRSP